jgi:hypothetical protein
MGLCGKKWMMKDVFVLIMVGYVLHRAYDEEKEQELDAESSSSNL